MSGAINAAPELSREIRTLLVERGFEPARSVLLSPLGEKKGRRWAYRVETERGDTVKVRLYESAQEAHRVYALRANLEEAFAPAVACHGPVLIEEWIEGSPLAEGDSEAWAAPAGALLGRLHARGSASDEPATVSTARWRDAADSDLQILTAAGSIDSDEAKRLREELRRRDPGTSPTAVIHTDFCADNMVIDSRGRLRVIDNEGVAVGAADYDLGRTFHLWPMSEAAWMRFRRSYIESACRAPEAPGFWRIATVLLSARVFLNRSPARHDAMIVLLRRLMAGEYLSDADE